MISLARLVTFDASLPSPVYIQVAEGIIELIRKGMLHPGIRIQGTREFAVEIHLHRKTVVAAYQELVAEGWLETRPRKGFFVLKRFPDATPKKLFDGQAPQHYPVATNFLIGHTEMPVLQNIRPASAGNLVINDGFPDLRLVPVNELLKEYHSVIKRKSARKFLGYSAKVGSLNLRQELVHHLSVTRALHLSVDNIMITKGAQMAIYVTASMLLRPGDNVIVGDPGYFIANACFRQLGANLIHVPVDREGMDIDAVEKRCKQKNPDDLRCSPSSSSDHGHTGTGTKTAFAGARCEI